MEPDGPAVIRIKDSVEVKDSDEVNGFEKPKAEMCFAQIFQKIRFQRFFKDLKQ